MVVEIQWTFDHHTECLEEVGYPGGKWQYLLAWTVVERLILNAKTTYLRRKTNAILADPVFKHHIFSI